MESTQQDTTLTLEEKRDLLDALIKSEGPDFVDLLDGVMHLGAHTRGKRVKKDDLAKEANHLSTLAADIYNNIRGACSRQTTAPDDTHLQAVKTRRDWILTYLEQAKESIANASTVESITAEITKAGNYLEAAAELFRQEALSFDRPTKKFWATGGFRSLANHFSGIHDLPKGLSDIFNQLQQAIYPNTHPTLWPAPDYRPFSPQGWVNGGNAFEGAGQGMFNWSLREQHTRPQVVVDPLTGQSYQLILVHPVPAPTEITKQENDKQKVLTHAQKRVEAIMKLRASGGLTKLIPDSVKWQKEMRADRPLPDR